MRKGLYLHPKLVSKYAFCLLFFSARDDDDNERERDVFLESHLHKGSKTKALHFAQNSLSGHKAQANRKQKTHFEPCLSLECCLPLWKASREVKEKL